MKSTLGIFSLLLAGNLLGVQSVLMSNTHSGIFHALMNADKAREGDVKATDSEDNQPIKTTPTATSKADKIPDNRPLKEINIDEMVESLFKPFQNLFEPNKKPKLKTVVSLTEVVGPKHQMQSFRQDPLSSQFGIKEFGFMDDPFNFDLGKMFPSFVPKISKVDVIWPVKHGHEKRTEPADNSEPDLLKCFHTKRDVAFKKLDQDKARSVPDLFPKLSAADRPVGIDLENIPLDEAGGRNADDQKEKICSLVRALPYIEGAIGGVMFVMLILVIASWRIRKPSGVWARVPFLDKTEYIEKV